MSVTINAAPAAHMLGAKALKSLIASGGNLQFVRSRLNESLFVGEEAAIYKFVEQHMAKYSQLPALETVVPHFPILAEMSAPEAPSYYLDLLQNRYEYNTINQANLDSQAMLKGDKSKTKEARSILAKAVGDCIQQQYRMHLSEFGKEGAGLLHAAYKATLGGLDGSGIFGWPYLDYQSGGLLPGDVVSICGRPATGKSWLVLYIALCNWLQLHTRLLVVSMEMNTLAIAQRLGAMYAHIPAAQLKKAQLPTASYQLYEQKISHLAEEPGALWLLDGNLMASPDEIYALAHTLGCVGVLIDGAYLMRNPNKKLDRFTRVAENVELCKARSSDLGMWTVASWQLKRDAAVKSKQKGKAGKADLEDIGYSDAIGQISSIVLGLLQEETVATANSRTLDVLKGRNGETGKTYIKWDFMNTDFSEVAKKEDNEQEKVDKDKQTLEEEANKVVKEQTI